MKKVHITTLGCSKNTVDSEVLMGRLEKNGNALTDNPGEADIIILNTCGFIEDAKKESIQAILEAVELKKQDTSKQVLVTGCLSQRYPVEITQEIPEVDAVFGTEAYDDILNHIGKSHAAVQNLQRIRRLTTPSHFAYMKIAEGCDHSCSFCAIPGIRGRYRSRKQDDLIEEAGYLAGKGIKELILVSQDTSYYGIDLNKKQGIIELLEKLSFVEGIRWIRVLYWYPLNFPMAFIDLIQSNEKIIPYLDLPMQHISASLLKKMRRAGTGSKLVKIFERAREILPDIALRTTVILGHPGETDRDFDELVSFIKEMRFDRLGTFVYSDEDHTPAFGYEKKVDRTLAQERRHRIMELQKEISWSKNQEYIGKSFTVLVDEYDADARVFSGRTFRDAPEIDNEVIITSEQGSECNPGDFITVHIEDASEYELYARVPV